jgi:nicotinate phosphoribosyltransferase
LLAGKLFGIPVKDTHAHSWEMLFDDGREAFKAYAQAMPNNCIFLVNTYCSVNLEPHYQQLKQNLMR